jgi:putative membrane protein
MTNLRAFALRRWVLRPLVKGATAGLVGGLAASWVMNRFQAAWSLVMEGREKPHGAQSIQEGSPEHGAGAELRKLGLDDPEDDAAERTGNLIAAKVFEAELSQVEKRQAGAAVHYVFGGASGALYGAVSEMWPAAAVCTGSAFGAAVWLTADEIAVPALGLSRPAKDYPLSKHAYALASHLVYGVTTEVVRKFVRRAM